MGPDGAQAAPGASARGGVANPGKIASLAAIARFVAAGGSLLATVTTVATVARLARLATLATLALGSSAGAQTDPGADDSWNFISRSTNLSTGPGGERIYTLQDDVVIVHGELVATSDAARYLTRARRMILTGHVELTQDSTLVRAPIAIYDRDTGIARFPRGMVVERPSGTAIGDEGIWRRHEHTFELTGKAAAADTSGTIDADAMTYDTERDEFWASGSVRLVDEATGITVHGGKLRYARRDGLAEIVEEPVALLTDEDDVPIRVVGDRMTYEPRTNVARAFGDVHVFRGAMEATADSAAFFRSEDLSVLTGSPEMVDGTTVVSGDRIELRIEGGGRRRVHVVGRARVANRFLDSRTRPTPADDAHLDGALDPDALDLDAMDPDALDPDEMERAREQARDLAREMAAGNAREMAAEAARELADEALAEAPGDLEGAARAEIEQAIRTIREAKPPADDAGLDAAVRAAESGVSGESRKDVVESLEAEAQAAADATAETATDSEAEPQPDPTPEWLKVPSEKLPTENLLFGDEIEIQFEDNELRRVHVVGFGRSKFFPNEAAGELTEWNDVAGDTLHVWFTDAGVDSVHVLGNGSGQYRFPAGELAGRPVEELRREGKLVDYHAPKIRYLRDTETMHLDGGSEVRYKTMVLTSGTVDFDARKETMTASGDPSPILVDVGDEIRGEKMNYHLPSQKGEIVRGRTQFENGYYSGRDVWKMGDNVIAVDDAIYTTCELAEPHYHFSCKNMKIYLEDKMVARPVVFKIGHIPVFALPFYMTSLKKGRHSGFLFPNVEFGVDDNRGRFIRDVGYYYAPNDYTDATLSFDFYPQQERIVSYLTTRYRLRYRFDGRVALKYNRDVPRNQKETALEIRHSHTFSETMSLTADGRFVSSADIYRNIDDAQRLDRELQSNATLSKRFEGSRNLRVDVRRRENLDTGTVNETLPTIDFTQPSRPITGSRSRGASSGAAGEGGSFLDDIYYSVSTRFVRERSVPADAVNAELVDPDSAAAGGIILQRTRTRTGSKADVDFRSTVDVLQYLRMSPSLSTEMVWVAEDAAGNSNAYRGSYSTALTARSEVYGTFLGGVGPVEGFRHVIRPSVSWRWAPKFSKATFVDSTGTERSRFESFGGIGPPPGETNSMSFSLNNLVQTKLARGEQVSRYDLFNLQSSMSYNFIAAREGRFAWSNLSSSLTVLSSAPVNQTWSATHDAQDFDLLSSSVTTRARISSRMLGRGSSPAHEDFGVGDPEGPDGPDAQEDPVGSQRGPSPRSGGYGGGEWSLDVSHTANRTPSRNGLPGRGSSQLVLSSQWSPTRNWNVRYNTQYDLQNGINTSQSWSVQRKIHHWELSFDRRLLGREWQYYFRISLTDIPDIKLERGDDFRGRSGLGGLGALGSGSLF